VPTLPPIILREEGCKLDPRGVRVRYHSHDGLPDRRQEPCQPSHWR
jgi:hypothetical protein